MTKQHNNYSVDLYGLNSEVASSIHIIKSHRTLLSLFFIWLEAICLIALGFWVIEKNLWGWYFVLIFFIAGRQGALLQLVHEATHGLISKSKKINRFVGEWLCANALGVNYEGYVFGHFRHHAMTATDQEPKSDSEKYRIVDFKNPRLYMLFFADLLGITALKIFFNYDNYESDAFKKRGMNDWLQKIKSPLRLVLVQLILLGLVFRGNIINYILLWLVPAMSCHMFLMRIRGIAEHGLAKQLGVVVETGNEGNFYTRSFATPYRHYKFVPLIWLERLLIGSLSVYYHHEHHLFPNVPYYNLKMIHSTLADKVAKENPDVYASGYFAAALRNLFYPSKKTLKTLSA